MSLVLIYLFDNRIGNLCQAFSLTFEVLHGNAECLFSQFLFLLVAEFFFGERSFHSQRLKQFHLATFVVVVLDSVGATVPNHVHNIHTDTFAH